MPSEPIVIERHIAAPPHVVYAHLTQGERWTSWQGVAAELVPEPGGTFAVTMENGMRAEGAYVELVPHRRVVFTWGWTDHPEVPPGSSTVEIALTPTPRGTLLTLTHSGLPDEEIDSHTAGWNEYLPRLGEVAAAAQGG